MLFHSPLEIFEKSVEIKVFNGMELTTPGVPVHVFIQGSCDHTVIWVRHEQDAKIFLHLISYYL